MQRFVLQQRNMELRESTTVVASSKQDQFLPWKESLPHSSRFFAANTTPRNNYIKK
jgi:hypothetical protein